MIFNTLFMAATALASPAAGGGSVLVGTAAAFDGNPASMSLSLRGELVFAGNDAVSVALALPVGIHTTGDQTFGISSRRTVFELPVTFRVRFPGASPVRVYGDAGIGPLFGTRDVEGWGFSAQSSRTGWMTRTAIGCEIGKPEGGLAAVIEPVGFGTHHVGDSHSVRYGVMVGLGYRY